MRHALAIALVAAFAGSATAQTRKPLAKKPAAPPPTMTRKEAPDMVCPNELGVGVKTHLRFCDVMTGTDPAAGIKIALPPHKGPVTLTFDLHNRQTYSEEQVRAKKAFARYTASVGVLTQDNTLIQRAVVQSEFRTAADLLDRVGGGAGGSVKAVAPTGSESVTVTIPEAEDQVSILGEKLTVERSDGTATYSQPGRPVADVSNVMIEYKPAPPKRRKM
ncbi:MAG TPA: hypothetical protein VEU08_14230 [Vicinamibacterales bacterium]|nr:hypothetical protein [Vicinamibacterales bacterium]